MTQPPTHARGARPIRSARAPNATRSFQVAGGAGNRAIRHDFTMRPTTASVKRKRWGAAPTQDADGAAARSRSTAARSASRSMGLGKKPSGGGTASLFRMNFS